MLLHSVAQKTLLMSQEWEGLFLLTHNDAALPEYAGALDAEVSLTLKER